MQFNSIAFIIFFPIVTILFYLIPHKYRWILLLAASCFFYMWFIPKYIFILLATITIDYTAGILMEHWKSNHKRRKLCLIVSIVATCIVLFIFKYLNFCSANFVALAQHFGWKHPTKVLSIVLPIGLSFHTFQSLSYVIEVFLGKQKAERHFGYYSLYVMFYPQLVTGPIERPQNLLQQLHEEKFLNYDNIANGLRLILFGLLLKMVVADNVGSYVDQIYAHPDLFSSWDILIGLIFYSFQIYADFFGYSSIALGCALSMGYTLTDNFKNPYLSDSVKEFWHRWHISLSTWFRDYLYIPLGGNRVSIPRWMLNTVIVFTVCGIWHGANWTFLIWGFAYGLLLIIERLMQRIHFFDKIKNPYGKSVIHLLNILKTFLIVTFLWSIFRAPSFSVLNQVLHSLFNNGNLPQALHVNILTWLALLFFVILDILLNKSRFDVWCGKQNTLVRWFLYAVMIFTIIVFSSVQQTPFIYFQF